VVGWVETAPTTLLAETMPAFQMLCNKRYFSKPSGPLQYLDTPDRKFISAT
jgi:hypothetical protein